MAEFKTITTVDELIDQDGKQIAFLPTGKVTYRDGVPVGVDYFTLVSVAAPGRTVSIKTRSEKAGEVISTYPRGYRWPVPVALEVDPPVTMTTYQRADGEPIYGEYGWVTDLEFFEDEAEYQEGVKIVREVWVRTEVEEIHLHPEDCLSCEKPWHGETCDQEPDE